MSLYPWQRIPRYHPQLGPWNILRASGRQPRGAHILAGGGCTAKEGENLFPLSNGTAALVVALRAMRLPAGSGVAVPIYNCVTVFEAVRLAGLRCVFIDNDPDTFGYDLDSLARRSKEVSAAILVHTFGYAGDCDAVSRLLPGRPIIEDCAHALGSRRGGVPLGFRGVAAAFSFNFHKPVSTGGGGWLIVNNPALLPAVRQQVEAMGSPPPRPPAGVLRRRMIKAALYRRPWYGLLLGCGILQPDREGVLRDVYVGRMSVLEHVLIEEGLVGLEDRGRRCRDWARRLTDAAGPLAPACHFVAAGQDWNGYLWPVVLSSAARREEAMNFLRGRGVDAFLLWLECLQTAAQYGYRPGDCPRLEDALPRMMMVPCYAELTDGQQEYILQAVKEARLGAGG
ncbi:MAG: DegT/DnrJ/EryC1/StrS family aminotransferase [Phycisphaerae bacterium]